MAQYLLLSLWGTVDQLHSSVSGSSLDISKDCVEVVLSWRIATDRWHLLYVPTVGVLRRKHFLLSSSDCVYKTQWEFSVASKYQNRVEVKAQDGTYPHEDSRIQKTENVCFSV